MTDLSVNPLSPPLSFPFPACLLSPSVIQRKSMDFRVETSGLTRLCIPRFLFFIASCTSSTLRVCCDPHSPLFVCPFVSWGTRKKGEEKMKTHRASV
mmetsp:Transcript_33790/g.66904  ORF Transcript_33790/g.66904 Transcript_33790/m.66904 type:complete len:97 (+) Transcript_33790:86-376(+)